MKLIIAGASGYVATEVIRRSLSLPQITSVIAVARRSVSAPDNLYPEADISKLHSAVIKEYDEYPEDVKKQFADADACIWTVAITPGKVASMAFEDVRRICHDYTFVGLKAMLEARGNAATPFRFLYMSGYASERDQSKPPRWLAKYSLLRGETENQVLAFAAERDGLEVCVAKPGFITTPGNFKHAVLATALKWTGIVPKVALNEISFAMLDQVVNGFEKEPLLNEDLVRLGTEAIAKAG